MYSYYLQKGDDTTAILEIDMLDDFDFDLPKSDYKMIDNVGEGSFIDGYGSLKGRNITCSYRFKGNNIFERNDLLDWFSKSAASTIYLYRNTRYNFQATITAGSSQIIPLNSSVIGLLDDTLFYRTIPIASGLTGLTTTNYLKSYTSTSIVINGAPSASISNADIVCDFHLGRIKGRPALGGGESWKNFRMSDNVKFNFLSKESYFESTEAVYKQNILSSSTEHIITFTIPSMKCNANYILEPSSWVNDFTIFQVKSYENYGFRASYNYKTTSVEIKVTNKGGVLDLNIDSNMIYQSAFSENSSPFMLDRGANTLYVQGQKGIFKVEFYERYL